MPRPSKPKPRPQSSSLPIAAERLQRAVDQREGAQRGDGFLEVFAGVRRLFPVIARNGVTKQSRGLTRLLDCRVGFASSQ